MNRNFRPDLELVDYINAFIEKNKESLSWQDIVITETGATRCKTNIRFSLDRLRKLGLVRKKNSQDKRTLLPTVLGQLVVHYFIWNYRNSKDATRPGESLSSDGYLYFSSQLQHLQTPTTLTNFLQHVKNNFKLNNQDLKKISNYANRFTEIVLKGLTIDKEKVKYNAEDIKGKDYDALLSELNNDYIFLRGNLGSNQDKS